MIGPIPKQLSHHFWAISQTGFAPLFVALGAAFQESTGSFQVSHHFFKAPGTDTQKGFAPGNAVVLSIPRVPQPIPLNPETLNPYTLNPKSLNPKL